MNVQEFLNTLSTRNQLLLNTRDIRRIKAYVNSDGCTFVRDIFRDACIAHDFYYRTHRDLYGNVIDRKKADGLFLQYMRHSAKGKFEHVLAFVFWASVRAVGWKFWDGN